MKIFFTFFLSFFCSAVIVGQKSKIDSIDNLIGKATSDTQRINLINKKISILSENNIDSAIRLCMENIEIAAKINYKKGEADSRAYLADNFCNKGEFEKAKDNLESAARIFFQLKDSIGFGKLYYVYGKLFGMQSRYDSAIFYFEKAVDIFQLTGNKSLLNNSFQNIAISYFMQSNYPKTLIYQQKALKAAEDENNIYTQSLVTMNIGLTYESMGDSTRAEQSFRKAIILAQSQKIKSVELYSYSNLANLYDQQHKFEKAYEYAMKTVELGQQLGDQATEASGYFIAASSLAGQQKFTEAINLCKHAIAVADSSNQPLSIYQANSMMGTILKKAGKYIDAIPFFEKGFHELTDADIYDNQTADSYASLAECYEKTGNYSKALYAFKTSAKITDSITRKDNIRKATELALNYEFEKKQQVAKAEQQKQKEVANAKQLALFVGLILTMILALVALNGYRNKQRANALLKRQKHEIQNTLTELKATQAQLIQSEKMASLGELTAGIAHEIQNPLNFVNNFAEVSIELSEELKEEIDKSQLPQKEKENFEMIIDDLVQNQQKINHHGKRADAIVKGMLLHSRASTGQKEPTDINALADEYLRLSYHGLRAKEKAFNATLETDFDEKIEKINIVPQDVGRVLLNLFTNAFYSVMEKKKIASQKTNDGNYEPTVSICTKKLDGKVEIHVKDNGMGIPQKALDKIFHPFFTTKPAGQGTGLGLSLSYDIITKAHGGTINVETREGEGAKFIITLPVV